MVFPASRLENKDSFKDINRLFKLRIGNGFVVHFSFSRRPMLGAGADMRQLTPFLGRDRNNNIGHNPLVVNNAIVRGVILGRGQSDGGTVIEPYDALHGAFTECLFAHQNRPVMILQRGGYISDALALPRSTNYRHGKTQVMLPAPGIKAVRTAFDASFRVDNQLPALQKQFGYVNGRA